MTFLADYDWGDYDDEQARVAYYMNLFSQVRLRRGNFEVMWEEAAALCWPEHGNVFTYGHGISPGTKKSQFQIDSSAAIASHRFMSIVDSLVTPHTMMWSKIQADNKDLMRDRSVALYFDRVSEVLWDERYEPAANFLGQNQLNWQSYGVFGNFGMRCEELKGTTSARGLSYRHAHVGEIYVLQNHQGVVDGYIRYFRRDARQAYQQWGEKIPEVLQKALQQNSKELYGFIEVVHPQKDYTPWELLTPKGKPWTSCYLSVEGFCILEDSGYRSLPTCYARYMQAPEEDYGRGPAQMVLPALKTLNAVTRDYLEAGQLAVKPAYLVGDDGLMDFRAHAGAFNYTQFVDGKPQIAMLPRGELPAAEEMLARQGKHVEDAFLVSLFARLWDEAKKGSQRSPREVLEDAEMRGFFLAPALGRLYTEYLGPLTNRELDTLSWLRKLPPMPPALKEADGEYKIVYTSPLSRAVRNSEVVGAMQTVEFAREVVNVTGDPSLMDTFDFDTMLAEIGDIRNVPERWFADQASKKAKAQARAQSAERERQAKELPGKAAIMKAQAINAKAQTGGNIGGTLSGTPSGGMPMMPGSPGQPGAPGRQGIPGQPGGY